MKILIHPTYFPNIATFAVLAQNDICWEVADNYQKQTYRNRCYICTDQGKHMLSIPIQHVGGKQGRQKYKDVLLENSYAWQRQHWRTLQTAYRTSPFFEFYEDDIAPLYEQEHESLMAFNLQTIRTVCECLQTEMPEKKTSKFELEPDGLKNVRKMVVAKGSFELKQESYAQVFGDRHGFIANTSILDLLFNEGTNALSYLKQQNLDFLHA